MTAALLVACALGGLLVGGFCNTVIVRAPDIEPLLRPGPKCPECQAPIAWRDTVPVVSWFALKGKCRSCSAPIPSGYPMVEVANAVLWVAAGIRFGTSWILIPYLFLFSVLLVQSVIDLEMYRLLDRITFPAIGISLVLIAGVSLIYGEPRWVIGAVIGGLGYFVFLFVPFIIYPKGLGFGDVKLALLMGLYMGWLDPFLPLFGALFGFVLGVVAGGVLYFVRGRESAEVPFGPWLALGTVIAILASSSLVDLYAV